MAATAPLNPHSPFPIFLFLILLTSTLAATSTNPDLPPLINFKAASDPTNRLSDWDPSAADPCNFTGVTCLKNRVTRLVLENLNLTTTGSDSFHLHLHQLASLTHLRVLSLKSNSLAGPIPDSLANLTSLKLLFLSHNRFSGGFPLSLLSLSRLYRLDLAHNNFSGAIPGGPTTLSRLTHLLTLRLEENNFTGSISSLVLPPSLHDFNVSGNRLTGGIPKSMSGFPASAFSHNAALCGEPLVQACKAGSLDPTLPGSGGAAGGGPISSPGGSGRKPREVVASSPSSLPTAAAKEAGKPTTTTATTSKIGPVAVIAIILGDVLVLAVVSLLLYYCFWRNYAAKLKLRKSGGGGGGAPPGKLSSTAETEKIVYSSSPYPNPNPTGPTGGPRMMMVFFEGAKRFELEDLLRASAEMLGKGAFGTAYKAVLDDGNVVAVKRLKDANLGGGAAKFEQQMEVLGRLRHPNLVSLRAYYFAREEKLLVYDYMANGSLFWLLHGNRGPGRTPLDWTTRLKIAAGAARGLAFIHSSCKALKLTHGNIKSTNVLLDRSGNARVSDFGLSTFASSSSSSAIAGPRTNGYRAPELTSDPRKLTQKSDVYSFGVLLLELLTGKCPSLSDCSGGMGAAYGGGGGGGGVVDLPRWVQSVVREEWTAEVFDLELMRYKDIEEEMVGLLQIAMTCTSPVPNQRPRMSQVVKMIEELRGAEVSPAHETVDSVSDSPSLSEDTTCGATSQ